MENESNEAREKMKAKIKKVLTLLNGAKTEGEAKAASLKLQQLLAKGNISMAEIEAEYAESPEHTVDEVSEDVGAGSATSWKTTLAYTIAKNYRCDTYLRCTHKGGKETAKHVVFVGQDEDAQIARDVFAVSVRVAQRLYRAWCGDERKSNGSWWKATTAIRNGWYHGFVRGLADAYAEQVSSDSELALAVQTPALVRERMDELSKGFKSRRSRGIGLDSAAFAAGTRSGHDFGCGDRLTA